MYHNGDSFIMVHATLGSLNLMMHSIVQRMCSFKGSFRNKIKNLCEYVIRNFCCHIVFMAPIQEEKETVQLQRIRELGMENEAFSG